MLSNKTKYALKALIGLASETPGKPVLIGRLAVEQGIPRKFLEAILLELKGIGVVHSKQGKHGGYYLAGEPKSVTLGKIIRAMEGPLALLPCVSQTAYQRCDDCHDERMCGLRLVLKDVRDGMAAILDNTTLADVKARVGTECETLSFDI
jgi:Rrf2 family protein